MDTLMPFLVGLLFAAGLYLLLRRNLPSLFVGLVLLGHATNLLLLSSSPLRRDAVPLVGEERGAAEIADPLPQALVLTAIVIGLGVQAFLLVLVHRLVAEQGGPDLDQARTSEESPP